MENMCVVVILTTRVLTLTLCKNVSSVIALLSLIAVCA